MMNTIILNDLTSDRRAMVTFTPEDFERVEANWEKDDKILVDMQTVELFKGRTCWKELEPVHWRVMITQNLVLVSALSDEEQADPMNLVVSSLTFLLSGLIKCLESRSESSVELLRVTRVDDTEVLFDYSASLNMRIEYTSPTKGGLRVIVDNT